MNIYKGDIYYANLSPVVGCEQGGNRPVLLIQNNIGNRYSPTVIVAAITSRTEKTYLPTHIHINGQHHGLRQNSMVLLEQVRTIDRSRLGDFIGHIDKDTQEQVNRALIVSLDLNSTEES